MPGLLVLCGLSACAQEPVIHVPPRYAKKAQLIPPSRTLVMDDGGHIPVRIWKAKAPERGLILALHGFNDSRDAWEMTAPAFAAAGFTVWAPDQRGFGGAPDRGNWAGEGRMVRDTAAELAVMAKENPGRPLWLMGESMGGAVAMLTIRSGQSHEVLLPPLAGTVLLAPAVWKPGVVADAALDLLTALFPDGRVTGREVPVHVVASDNVSALIRLYLDPLTLHSTKLVALKGLVSLTEDAADAAPAMQGAVLLLYGDHDQLVPPSQMAPVWRRLPSGVRRDVITGGHHLLLRDRNRQLVVQDILTWLSDSDAPLPSGGDPAAAAWSVLHEAGD